MEQAGGEGREKKPSEEELAARFPWKYSRILLRILLQLQHSVFHVFDQEAVVASIRRKPINILKEFLHEEKKRD